MRKHGKTTTPSSPSFNCSQPVPFSFLYISSKVKPSGISVLSRFWLTDRMSFLLNFPRCNMSNYGRCALFCRSLCLELTSWAYPAININSCLQAITKDISTPADIAPSALETIIFYCFVAYISALTYYLLPQPTDSVKALAGNWQRLSRLSSSVAGHTVYSTRAFQFAIRIIMRIDSFCKKNRPFDSLVVMQLFLLI